MRGVIEKLHGTYGFIRGQDRIGYFFIPSSFVSPLVMFEDLTEGLSVEFAPNGLHPKGPRAADIVVIPASSVDLPDEEV